MYSNAKTRTRSQRTTAAQEEIVILLKYGKLYADCPKRSHERCVINDEALHELRRLGIGVWTRSSTRQWWINNATKYPELAKLRKSSDQDSSMESYSSLPGTPVEPLRFVSHSFDDCDFYEDRPLTNDFLLDIEPVQAEHTFITSILDRALPNNANKPVFDDSTSEYDGLPVLCPSSNMYMFLSDLYRYLRHSVFSDPEERDAMQERAESRMHKLCQLLQSSQKKIHSIDNTVSIKIKSVKHEKELVRLNTNLFADKHRKKLMKGSNDFHKIYNGSFDHHAQMQNIACVTSTAGELIYIQYSSIENNRYNIVYKGLCKDTGFSRPPSSIAVDEKACVVWVAGDNCVKGFKMETLECVDLLHKAGPCIAEKSSLVIWGAYIALANGESDVYIWHRQEFEYENVGFGSREGRRSVLQIKEDEFKPDLLCAIENRLAVASSSYETIHIFEMAGYNYRITSRFVGHTSGITSLLKVSDNELMSGSADTTARIWNLRTNSVFVLLVCNTEQVTTLGAGFSDHSSGLYDPLKQRIIMTGGNDGYVDVWSLAFKYQPIIHIKLESGYRPIFADYNGESNTITIVSRSTSSPSCIIDTYSPDG